MKTIFNILIDSIKAFLDNHMIERSGYIAFLLLLSLFPFMIFLLSFSIFLGNTSAGQDAVILVYSFVPENILLILEPITGAINESGKVPFLTFSSLVVLYTASSAVQAFKDGFHHTYKRRETLGIQLLQRIKSIFLILFLCTSLITISFFGLIFPGMIHLFNNYIGNITIPYLPLIPKISQWFSIFIGFLFLQSLYFFLGPKKMTYAQHFRGTVAALLLLIPTSYLIPIYIEKATQYHVIYGSLSTFILVILMLQIFSAIILWGAELNAAILRAQQHQLKKHI